ncbi:MAG: Fe-S cluster assembly protein SufD, partial [Pseudomonadota bacterium]
MEGESPAEAPAAFPGIDAAVATFANGRFRPDLSGDLTQPGLAVSSLSAVTAQDITIARDLFGALEAAGQEKVSRPLAILNTATAR